jgi:hypothetical protein
MLLAVMAIMTAGSKVRTPRGALVIDQVELSSELERELRAFARSAETASVERLDGDLRRHQWALTARRDRRLHAFLLGQTRAIDGSTFLHFGSLFSAHSALLPLFAHALRSTCALPGRWWLTMELDDPAHLRLFRALVPRASLGPGRLAFVRGEEGPLAREIEWELDDALRRLQRASRPRGAASCG